MVNFKQMLWEAYGPHVGALDADAQVVLQGLQSRGELNETGAKILRWDGLSCRFAVEVDGTAERIKIKPANLRIKDWVGDLEWAHSEAHFGSLPPDMTTHAAGCLRPRCVAQLSAGCRALRAALWLKADAEPLWEKLLVRRFGAFAALVARRVSPGAVGPSLYRRARGVRHLFREHLEVVRGGVDRQGAGFEVVACPTVSDLMVAGFGAQAAIRRAGGQILHQAIMEVETPLPELSTTLVNGGSLAPKVALTVTQPPSELLNFSGSPEQQVLRILDYLEKIHVNLLRVVRENGHRSLAMPTLCTGGMGMPPHLVAIGAVKAVHQDFCDHPADPIRVRIACFEDDHIPAFNSIKNTTYEMFYTPEEISSVLRSSLFGPPRVSEQ